MVRLIVTGGRYFGEVPPTTPATARGAALILAHREVRFLYATLDRIRAARGIACVIEGRCPTGADKHARAWAAASGVANEGYPARWAADGRRAAGPIRNARMIAESRPDGVVAFPGGTGTADCVAKARRAGLNVMEVAFEAEAVAA